MDRRKLVASEAINEFVNNQANHGHYNRTYGQFSEDYFKGISNAVDILKRLKDDLPKSFSPRKIMDLGCSAGQSSVAIKKVWPNAEVVGLDIEEDAVNAARDVAEQLGVDMLYIVGSSSQLPFETESYDLIICHTVIEHVDNVFETLKEIRRCLIKNGRLSLEAPNYSFPYEPHVKIYFLRCLGKKVLKFQMLLLGRKNISFVEHLNFVTTMSMKNTLNDLGFCQIIDRYERKLKKLSSGAIKPSKRWFLLASFIKFSLFQKAFKNFAPSLMLLAKK